MFYIWLVEKKRVEYDTLSLAIVRAESEHDALRVHPNGYRWGDEREAWMCEDNSGMERKRNAATITGGRPLVDSKQPAWVLRIFKRRE